MTQHFIAVWDIDGTMADNHHRAVHLERLCVDCGAQSSHTICHCGAKPPRITQEQWDAFLDPDLLLLDTPIADAQRVITQMRKAGIQLCFVTGRNESLRDATTAWISTHFGLKTGEQLFMRPTVGGGVPASVMKEILLEKVCKHYNVVAEQTSFIFFEDDPYVFDMYQKYGMVVKCPEGLAHFYPPGKTRAAEPLWNR